jgi:hypothetical protein
MTNRCSNVREAGSVSRRSSRHTEGDEERDTVFCRFSYEYPDDHLMQVAFLRSAVVSLQSLHVHLSYVIPNLYHDILENIPRCKR